MAGDGDTLNLLSGNDVTVQVGTPGEPASDPITIDPLVLNVDYIETINADSATNSTLIGDNYENDWVVSPLGGGSTIGTLTRTKPNVFPVPDEVTVTSIRGFKNFTGGSDVDRFDISAAVVNNVDTGAGNDFVTVLSGGVVAEVRTGTGADSVDVNVGGEVTNTIFGEGGNDTFILDGTVGTADGGTGTDSVEFTQRKTITVGSAFSGLTLVAVEQATALDGGTINARPGVETDWTIDGLNSGSVIDNGSNPQLLLFDGFEIINGGDGIDRFVVTGAGQVDGLVTSGAGNNELTFTLNGGNNGVFNYNGSAGTDTVIINGGVSGPGIYSASFNPNVATYDRFRYENGANTYDVNLLGANTITDNTTANLTINGSTADDIINLTNTTYSVNTAVNQIDVNYFNKRDITVSGSQVNNDTININGAINLGTNNLVLSGANLNASGPQITANSLTLNSVRSVDGPINTTIGQLSVNSSGAVSIAQTGALNLVGLSTVNSVAVTASGDINGNNLVSNAALSLNAGGANVDLTGANQLTGDLTLAGGTVNLTNNVRTSLASVNATTLNVTVNGGNDLVGPGPVLATTANLSAVNGDINLLNTDFDTVNISNTNNVRLDDINSVNLANVSISGGLTTNSSGLSINRINAASVNLNAGAGSVTDADSGSDDVDIVAGSITIRAQNGIGTVGNALETQTSELDVINAGAGGSVINLTNAGNVLVTICDTADISFENIGDVTINRIDAGFNDGDLNFIVNNGSVYGDPTKYFLNPPDITADTAFIYVDGTFGLRERPIGMKIRTRLRLYSQSSAFDFVRPTPPGFIDDSLESLTGFTDFGLGLDFIEVESLADIDPAIFTEVRNYYHDEVAINMPADQKYAGDSTEEDEEEKKRREEAVN